MNAALFLIIGVAVLIVGYIFYGGWLAKKWGVDNSRPTPAHTMEDGKDYCPAKAPVLMGHHFSSIAGAGPINGPIQAAVFGWVPVMLWVLIGGIFFGGVHDFGALFVCDRCDEEARKAQKRCKLYTSFKLSYWGWMDVHTGLVVLPEEKISTNASGHSAAQVFERGLFHKQKKNLFRKERAL